MRLETIQRSNAALLVSMNLLRELLPKIAPCTATLADNWLIHEFGVALFRKQAYRPELRILKVTFDADGASMMKRNFKFLRGFAKEKAFDFCLLEYKLEAAPGRMKGNLAVHHANL
ncbi:hypothetical protein LMG6871_04237 [Ralstonia edaphis]|uniref:hypothetical protein n=1 Tax=Ralstonia edaphi TaxID=3058599 RepID=UPI0028F6A845|nr:hypothetical protein [Ralstonia sp. LMG 6871]CAJ0720814.1 hypothetical protein LMG6871_04237 [Ralstonia sp. LMG 6871]